jgi:ribonuclease-3
VQEKAQEHFGVTPQYKVTEEVGPDHDKRFTTGIFFGNEQIAIGKGKSKQEAEQKAAQEAIKTKGWLE